VNAKRKFVFVLLAAIAIGACFIIRGFLGQQGQRKLSRAAFEGDLVTVQRCVAAGVRIDATPMYEEGPGFPALFGASYSGHEQIVHFLLDQGANPNLPGMSNPLIVACWRRHPAVVRLLLDYGADPNVSGEGTPMYAAKSTGQRDLVALLCERGAHE
jgi:ankyrin repeat protein